MNTQGYSLILDMHNQSNQQHHQTQNLNFNPSQQNKFYNWAQTTNNPNSGVHLSNDCESQPSTTLDNNHTLISQPNTMSINNGVHINPSDNLLETSSGSPTVSVMSNTLNCSMANVYSNLTCDSPLLAITALPETPVVDDLNTLMASTGSPLYSLSSPVQSLWTPELYAVPFMDLMLNSPQSPDLISSPMTPHHTFENMPSSPHSSYFLPSLTPQPPANNPFSRILKGSPSSSMAFAQYHPLTPQPSMTANAPITKRISKKASKRVNDGAKRGIQCTECGSTFKRKADLRRHQLCVHVDLRPFACPHACGAAFSRKDVLKRHLTNKTADKFCAGFRKNLKQMQHRL